MEEKQKLLIERAKSLGIVDVDFIGSSTDTNALELACNLIEKHQEEIYKRLEERRKEK